MPPVAGKEDSFNLLSALNVDGMKGVFVFSAKKTELDLSLPRR